MQRLVLFTTKKPTLKKSLISVIMPVFNAEQYLEKAIESILNQSYSNIELLLIDDASTDKSYEILRSYSDKRIRLFRNTKNLGSLKSRNILFNKVKGDYITFQDADDWSSPNRFEKQLNAFWDDPVLGICGTFAQYYSMSGAELYRKTPKSLDHEIKSFIKTGNQFCSASIMIRKAVFNSIGGYREFFHEYGNYDYDWSSRICQRFKAKNIDVVLYHVSATPFSNSRNVKKPQQLISVDIVRHLILERELKGTDSIERSDFETVNKLKEKLLQPYMEDESLLYRKNADQAAYNSMWKEFVISSFLAFSKRPSLLINLKYLIGSFIKYLNNKFFNPPIVF